MDGTLFYLHISFLNISNLEIEDEEKFSTYDWAL